MDKDALIEKTLGHPVKLRLLLSLRKPGAGYMSLNKLAKTNSVSAPRLSRALRSLDELGIVAFISAGNCQLWRLRDGWQLNVIGPILDVILKKQNLASFTSIPAHSQA